MLVCQNEYICFKIGAGNPPLEVERRTAPHKIVGFGRGEGLGGLIFKDYSCCFVGYLKHQDAKKAEVKKTPKQIWKEDERTLMRVWESKFDEEDEESFFEPATRKSNSPERSFIKTTYSQASEENPNLGANNSSISNFVSKMAQGSDITSKLHEKWSKIAPMAPRTEAVQSTSRPSTHQAAVKSSTGKPTAPTERPVSPFQAVAARQPPLKDQSSPLPRKRF